MGQYFQIRSISNAWLGDPRSSSNSGTERDLLAGHSGFGNSVGSVQHVLPRAFDESIRTEIWLVWICSPSHDRASTGPSTSAASLFWRHLPRRKLQTLTAKLCGPDG